MKTGGVRDHAFLKCCKWWHQNQKKLWKNSQWGWWLVGHNGNHSPQIGGVWRGRGPDGEQLGRRPGNTRISSEDQRKYDLVDLTIWSRRKGTSGWWEWRHKRKWERKREEEDAESLFVSTKDQLQWWPGFSKIEGNRFCYWTWKKNIYILSLYTLFRLTGKICCFFYPAVSVAAKEGALYGQWGG